MLSRTTTKLVLLYFRCYEHCSRLLWDVSITSHTKTTRLYPQNACDGTEYAYDGKENSGDGREQVLIRATVYLLSHHAFN